MDTQSNSAELVLCTANKFQWILFWRHDCISTSIFISKIFRSHDHNNLQIEAYLKSQTYIWVNHEIWIIENFFRSISTILFNEIFHIINFLAYVMKTALADDVHFVWRVTLKPTPTLTLLSNNYFLKDRSYFIVLYSCNTIWSCYFRRKDDQNA